MGKYILTDKVVTTSGRLKKKGIAKYNVFRKHQDEVTDTKLHFTIIAHHTLSKEWLYHAPSSQ